MTLMMTADAVGGVWTYALDLGRELARRGHEVHLATMGPRPDAEKRGAAEAAGIALHESDFALEWQPEPWDDVGAAGEWLLELEKAVAPDVVHLNGYVHGALPWRAPTVVVAHSDVLSWHHWVRRAPAGAEWARYADEVRRGLGAAGAVVAPTQAVAEDVRREYGVGDVRVIPNFRAPGRYAPGAKERFVLSAGRLWDEAKNGAALAAVAEEVPFPIRFVGDGTPGGRLAEGELADLYARAAVFGHPARYEPFGLAVLEAALSACALVLGDIPSLRENWEGAALFVSPDDRGALAAALVEAMERSEELGAAARGRAARFSMAEGANAYLGLYESLARQAVAA